MKLGKLLNEVLDLKAIDDQIDQASNQLAGLKKQVSAGVGELQRENQKLQQDNATLNKQVADMQKAQSQNKMGTGTVAKVGGPSTKATSQATSMATGAPAPPFKG
jgi:regulator of replication initiation timing